MATKLSRSDYPVEFDLDDIVTFPDPDGGSQPLRGKVVRVYNTGDLYHVLVAGTRYQVECSEMTLAEPEG